MKILLVEDERSLAESIMEFMQKEGAICELALTYEEGIEKIYLYNYDVVLLDITLPDGNGLELLRQLKENRSTAGVLIISAKNSIDDKIHGLDLGADDYITKPFNLAELNARARSVFRRRHFEGYNLQTFNEISVNLDTKEASVHDTVLDLTRKEYDLLLFFLVNRNRILTKESIAEHLWGDHMDLNDSFDFIYTHIKNLRKKLTAAGAEDYIRTAYGMGYKFEASA